MVYAPGHTGFSSENGTRSQKLSRKFPIFLVEKKHVPPIVDIMVHFIDDSVSGAGRHGVREAGTAAGARPAITGSWDQKPFMVVWEMTRACGLACKHCRAEAQRRSHPLELDTQEARRMILQVAELGPQLFILTGGDPAMRKDLEELVGFASAQGLRVAVSPGATAQWLDTDLPSLKHAGLRAVSLSLDGATEKTHDAFRGIRGTWDRTLLAVEGVKDAGLSLQINTTITADNLWEFRDFVRLMEDLEPDMWSVFGMVPTGRGKRCRMPDAKATERMLAQLADLAGGVNFSIKTTELPQYRRLLVQQGKMPESAVRHQGVGDGKGFVFISHIGEIFPSGFLPVSAGNVANAGLGEVYRSSPLFRLMRNAGRLGGKCGVCEFRSLCGGSRARAFAMTGDYLAAEPLCPYQPAKKLRTKQSMPALS